MPQMRNDPGRKEAAVTGLFISLLLIKPQTFMNESGKIVPLLLKQGIKPENMLVVHDELEKSFSYVGMHFGGGAKGHNGLRSIIDMIGKDFWRLRFGIGRPDDRDQVGDFVLMPFTKQEEEFIPALLVQAVSLILGK